ncbi:MAG: hypothetical protein JW779_15740, partial [Candidatus Thorarchaeota archaeon]|nr:hypothetical protein [Candidatus Thorarchaeota archaeon]
IDLLSLKRSAPNRFFKKMYRLSIPATFFFISAYLFSDCNLPSGCGPGDIPSNPAASNLIDYTVPTGGSIVRSSEFQKLTIHFLTPIQIDTFGVDDDIRLFQIFDFWGPLHTEYLDGHEDFITTSRWIDDSCDVEGYCKELELTIRTGFLTPGFYYRIRILGEDHAELDFPVIGGPIEGPESLLLSDAGVALEHDVDILIGIVGDDAPTHPKPNIVSAEPYYITQWSECWQHDLPECLIPPHDRIRITFSDLMGFIYFLPHPLWGFNFAYSDDEWNGRPVTALDSDSIQGLEPGAIYYLLIPNFSPSPSSGIPPTMDRNGNLLQEPGYYAFKTSHVRILFPFHTPFSDEPDDWYGQLKDLGASSDYLTVETTSSVTRFVVSANGEDLEVVYPDTTDTQNSYHYIEINKRINSSSDGISYLEVCAYRSDDDDSSQEVSLGCDGMYVIAPPPRKINIVSYNAYYTRSWRGRDWRERLSLFVQDVVVPYRPAIIAIQEVDTSDEEYMQHLMDEIYALLPGSQRLYFIANVFATGTGGDEGEAVIYDASQIRFVPSPPYGESMCPNVYQGYDYYQYYQETIDCHLNQSGSWGEVSRAIFEFPKNSGQFFSFYNTHIGPCDLDLEFEYIFYRHETFRDELGELLSNDNQGLEPLVLPPVFAGDMNTHELQSCSESDRERIRDLIKYFTNAPDPGDGWIDKVWVGIAEKFNSDAAFIVTKPPEGSVLFPFSGYEFGYIVIDQRQIYTDHSPVLVEVEAAY